MNKRIFSQVVERKEKRELTIELVPAPLWNINPRLAMGPTKWNILRKEIVAKADYRCEICQAFEGLETHEVWEYDDKKQVQKLARLIALCKNCHGIKHLGRAIVMEKGRVGELIKHFCEVNECNREEFERIRRVAFMIWETRSKYEWTIDWGEFSSLIETNNPPPSV